MTSGPVVFAGAVLAGGRSRRMGRDKALIAVDGVAMAVRVAGALHDAGAVEVLVVGGAPQARTPLGLRFVADRFPGEGPLGGLVTALAASEEAFVAVCACDLPWLDAGTIEALVGAIGGADVAVARTDRREPMCALWRRSTAEPVLVRAYGGGERAIHRVFADLVVVEVAAAPSALVNVNTPADLPGEGEQPTGQ